MIEAMSPTDIKYLLEIIPNEIFEIVNELLQQGFKRFCNEFYANIEEDVLIEKIREKLKCETELIIANKWIDLIIPFYEKMGWSVTKTLDFNEEGFEKYHYNFTEK